MATQTGSIDLSQAKDSAEFAGQIRTEIPTSTSQLMNDSGYIDASGIPTDISAFNNDSGYATNTQLNDGLGALETELSGDISDTNDRIDVINTQLEDFSKGVEIRPSVPYVSVFTKSGDTMLNEVRVTDSDIRMSDGGVTSTRITASGVDTTQIKVTRITPIVGGEGYIALEQRQNGHFSIKKQRYTEA